MSYDSDVVSATGGVGEADWDKIIKLCNRIRDSVGPTSMHQAMQSVMKRVKHGNPAVQIHALTLLEACVSNCGQDFQKELTTQFFQTDIKSILLGRYTDAKVAQRLKELLLSWSSEFKSAPHMKDLHKFMEQLRRDGVNFSTPAAAPPSSTLSSSSSPFPATAQTTQTSREEDDLRKAIQLSLQDSTNPPPSSSSSSSSPSVSVSRPVKKEARKVRAIYDFQAAEDNELSFRAGEIVTLLDDSDENWWRGETQLGQGLFPASFVSKNLNKDPEPSTQEKKKSKKKTKTGVSATNSARPINVGGAEGVVNEQKVDLLLDMLKSADVKDTSREESKTVKELESEVQSMRSVVEQTVQQLTAQEEAMQSVSSQFNEALDLYRKSVSILITSYKTKF
ncbi:Signal transducing adapter molecule 1 [Geodia barretti]|uniref:Signal transducing adapter molecule 1 n=1 Tax=Geodia barretti TaxID=519541 RepID=A0AA35SFX0_GEOBA|nr:Signal transducing adapter molecule 1 [Geodia barretti]